MNGGKFALYLIGIVAIYAALLLLKGQVFLTSQEGDAMHLMDIILRMAEGQRPHLDFPTPLGIAAFWPIAVFVQAGFGFGTSFMMSQVAIAAALILPIFYVARTRMDAMQGYAFGAVLLTMVMALVHGEMLADVTVSMYYNRWAWALAFLAVPIAIFPARSGGSVVIDAAILGLVMFLFILGKATFAVALAPGLIFALALRKAWSTLGLGVICVAILLAVSIAVLGLNFWKGYIGNLAEVASSGIRPRAGASWDMLLTGPRFVLGNIVLLAAIVILRKGEQPNLGVALLLLAPGFLYVTYQNWGNDQKWLALVALIVLMSGASVKHHVLAVIAAVLIAPSFWNMAISPLRNFQKTDEHFVTFFSSGRHTDVFAITARTNRVMELGTVSFKEPQFTALNEFADKVDDIVFQGKTYPSCKQEVGLIGVTREMAADLRRFGLDEAAKVFMADLSSGIWMFGEFEPLKGGTPWYYGGLPGFDAAEYVVVPKCPVVPAVFAKITEQLNEMDDLVLTQLRETELYTLYRKAQ